MVGLRTGDTVVMVLILGKDRLEDMSLIEAVVSNHISLEDGITDKVFAGKG
jgi:hypothetical protein